MKSFPHVIIRSHYNPGDRYIKVRLCSQSREEFAALANALRGFLENDVLALELHRSPEVADAWNDGLDAIERLAFIPSEVIYLEPSAAPNALALLCTYTVTLSSREGRWQLCCLFGLASMIPAPTKPLDLPQVPQEWVESPPPEDIVSFYEQVRDHSGNRTLCLTQAYFLLVELAKQKHPEPSVQNLILQLKLATVVLRTAIDHVF